MSFLLDYPERAGIFNYLGRGQHSFPDSSGDPGISHSGVNHGHRNAPHTILCQSIKMPNSSRLGTPPSRTQRRRPAGQPHFWSIYPPHITRTSYKCSLSQSYTFESHNNPLYSDNTRNYINSQTILQNRNTITKQLYITFEIRLLSSRIHVRLTNSPLPPQEATTRPAAVSYDGNVRLLCNPGPLSATCFACNTQSPTTISEYIHTIVRSLHTHTHIYNII